MRTTTGLDAAKLTGTVASARMGSGTASSSTVLYGDGTYKAEPVTDTTSIKNDISLLALQTAINGNMTAFGLKNSFIEQFENSTYIANLSTVGRDTTSEYVSSIYTSTTTTTPSTSSDWSGNTGNATFTSGGVAWNVSDDAVRSSAALSGDFTLNFTGATVSSGGVPAVYPTSEDATFDQDHEYGDMHLMTNSYWLQMAEGRGPAAYAAEGIWHGSTTPVALAMTTLNTDGIVGKFVRTGTELAIYIDTVLKHTFTGVTTTDMRACFAGTGATPRSVYTGISWDTSSTSTNATGSFTSTVVVPQDTVNKSSVGLVVLYKDNAGTNTLNTDIVAKVRANTGQAYQTLVLAGAGTYSDSLKIAIAPAIAVTAGQALSYEISFANQASGTKEARIYGVAMTY